MTAQHTPGQWRTKTMKDGSRNVVADNDFICEFSNVGGTERDKQEANGRLIAAAPDLLEALYQILELPEDSRIAYKIARKAIAKATGGAL